jgi:sulfur-oxidizing protein SoxX
LTFTGIALADGDPQRGRAIVADRFVGMCLLCHKAPIPEERFQGDLAPDLAGVGARLSREELRARVIDPRRANPKTIMPAYFSTEGLTRVAPQHRGKTIFSEQQVEHVVAYLVSLK